MSRYELGKKFSNIYLTKREAECMALMLQDKKNDDIAKELGLSPRTIGYYFEQMRKKLGVNTKFE